MGFLSTASLSTRGITVSPKSLPGFEAVKAAARPEGKTAGLCSPGWPACRPLRPQAWAVHHGMPVAHRGLGPGQFIMALLSSTVASGVGSHGLLLFSTFPLVFSTLF